MALPISERIAELRKEMDEILSANRMASISLLPYPGSRSDEAQACGETAGNHGGPAHAGRVEEAMNLCDA